MVAKPRRAAPHVSPSQIQQVHAQLAAGGLSHDERRRLQAVLRSHEVSAHRRRRRLKRLAIVLGGAISAMAIAAASFGLVPAIEAALARGATGSYTVNDRVCTNGRGSTFCQWLGTFQPRNGAATTGLAYGGNLPDGDGPGSVINVRYPGGSYVYAIHGTHTWVQDLLIALLVGTVVGFLLWLSPLGSGDRRTGSEPASA
jgi:uncharacterized iron-regulated membrane protein